MFFQVKIVVLPHENKFLILRQLQTSIIICSAFFFSFYYNQL